MIVATKQGKFLINGQEVFLNGGECHYFRVPKKLLNAPKKVHTYIGFNPNDYMTEVVEDRDRDILGEIIGKREHFAFDGILRLLVGANIQFEAIDVLKEIDVESVPSLWIFSTPYMERELQLKLVRYVQEGGKLVLYPQIPVKDKLGKPCTVLKDELQLGEWEVFGGVDYVDVLGIDSVNVKQRLRFSQYEGEAIASYTRKGGNEAAAYKKQHGQGEILVLGIAMGHDYGYQLEVIRKIAEQIGIQGHLLSTNGNLSLVERSGDGGSFIFVGNYDETEQSGLLYENSHPLFDGEEVALPPRSGAVFVRNYGLHPELEIEYATVELTDFHSSHNKIELTVQPVGKQGTLKVKVSGIWSVNYPVQPVNGAVTFNHLSEPMTIVFTKA